MSKPYVYLDRYKRDGFSPAIQRNMPTEVGSHTRAAFHGVGTRSLEVWVQPNGFWSVETGPSPVECGSRHVHTRGNLSDDSVWFNVPDLSEYTRDQIRDQVNDGPPGAADGEDFYRTKIGGSNWFNLTTAQVRAIGGIVT